MKHLLVTISRIKAASPGVTQNNPGGAGGGDGVQGNGDLRRVHCRPREQHVQSLEGGRKESEVS